jgi:hypothetical protein
MAPKERRTVRIGREYVVHPVAVGNGCFHPEVIVLEADYAVRATMASGRRRPGGWSANLGYFQHVHDGNDALAFGDLGRFFFALGGEPQLRPRRASCLTRAWQVYRGGRRRRALRGEVTCRAQPRAAN